MKGNGLDAYFYEHLDVTGAKLLGPHPGQATPHSQKT